MQRSQLQADGAPDPNFKGFGLSVFQSQIHVGNDGKAEALVKTVLLDSIFAFDGDPIPGSVPATPLLPPTQTFHVGFWFDNPDDAAACGFDPAKPTPFNAAHNAGPTAMISVPNAVSGSGPIATDPAGGAASNGNGYSPANARYSGSGGGEEAPALTHCSGGMCITSPH